MVKRALILVVVLCCARSAAAACSGSSPTFTAASASRAEVQACVNLAGDGDTINVPAGTATWGSRITLTEDVVIVGAGAGSTIITDGGFTIGEDGVCPGPAPRVSGFTFNSNGDYTFQIWCSIGWRIDHNTITYPDAQDAIFAMGSASTSVEGLIDNNTMTYARTVYFGEDIGNGGGNTRWSEPLDWGTTHYIYLENNSIIWTNASSGGYLNHLDGNQGCRYVLRFNTIQNGRTEAHSVQGDDNRACRAWEIYGNSWTNTGDPSFRQWFIRGGTGLIFDETSDGNALNNDIEIDNDRSHETSIAGQVGTWQMCGIVNVPPWTEQPNGNSFVDGNLTGQRGYPCRDQIGRSTDSFVWGSSHPNPAPTQAFQPAYFFHNTQPSGEIPVVLNCEDSGIPCSHQSTWHILENRDYYTLNLSFDGTEGVGRGLRSARPATCTANVAYWSTDGGGDWNATNGTSNDGSLDVCTATNTWTNDYYVPLAYPHPLASGGEVNANPTVTITSPTSNSTFSTSTSPLTTLAGTCSDDGTISGVTWANDRGGSGSATGTISWSVGSITLQTGANVITVTCTDDASATGTDTLTVTYTPAANGFFKPRLRLRIGGIIDALATPFYE